MAGTFLLITWSGGGNVNPFLSLGVQLAERGHAVHVLGPADLAPRFEAEGLAYRVHPSWEEWAAASPDVDPQVAWTRALAAEIVAEVQAVDPDVLVVDYMLPAALSVAESTALPTVALVHTVYAPVTTLKLQTMWLFGTLEMNNDLRKDLGLPTVDRFIDLLDRTTRVFVTAPREFDGPVQAVAPNVRYVGPQLEGPGVDAGWAPPSGTDPLVVISLGTTPMDEAPVLQRVLDAVSDMQVRAIATVGSHIDIVSFKVPPNATVEGYIRHAALLAHADLFVGHAGLGGILAALGAGVPMVCLPLGRDQPFNSARVEKIGAGRSIPPDSGVEVIRTAIASVLGNTAHHGAAKRLAEDIATSTERQLAATELEALLPS